MSTLQVKTNSKSYNFTMEVDQRRIKAGKTLRRLEKKQESKSHAWKGNYIVLG